MSGSAKKTKLLASASPRASPSPGQPSQQTVVYVLRHGERRDHVDFAWKRKSPRPFDPPLTEIGLKQADLTGRRLKELDPRPSQLLASPFLRTVQTAVKVSQHLGLKVKVEPGAAEWYNPRWFAQRPAVYTAAEFHGSHFPEAVAHPEEYTPVLTEISFPEADEDALYDRCEQLLAALLRRYRGESIVLVSHGFFYPFLLERLQNTPTTVASSELCSISKLIHDGSKWTVAFANDDSHCASVYDPMAAENDDGTAADAAGAATASTASTAAVPPLVAAGPASSSSPSSSSLTSPSSAPSSSATSTSAPAAAKA